MTRCPACRVEVEGAWSRCPLCGTPVSGTPGPSPLPAVPLRFSRRRLLRVVFLASLAVIAASFGVQLLLGAGQAGIGALRSVWLGLVTMWLVVLMAVRKRRNVAKGALYLVVVVGGASVYWDYLTGYRGWALTYAVPLVDACSVVALLISVHVMRTEVGDHILYSAVTVVLGLAPLVFLGLGWVGNPVPSTVCGALSLAVLLVLQGERRADVRHELAKRLNL
ncbi:hypothetical protein SAMN04488544_0125 [Microlunatus sagamiharensis]|uniref:Zinc ribbon domain-containing protein n=1 Tax=Microlunatus sagamiharensis TaxID=546874 RepID=A0A1H2LGW5_9ACTN|nr:DUF6320 domain-containing protein [Microlunatus sagamiharensis]SDU80149.1 hypothetical protein SAMN04488544_0125 [Microlunatus sagamiharensis]